MEWKSRDQLITRVRRLAAATADRVIIGIAGCPGSGKSTLASWLADALRADGLLTTRVPMDGFHLADVQLERFGLRDRKGAINTFDVHGYASLLRRVRADQVNVVYAPDFDRGFEQPVAGAIAVQPEIRVVVTEGHYLLVDDPAWRQVRAVMTETWSLELDDRTRVERLIQRHIEFGKNPGEARRWVQEVDEVNADLIRKHAHLADLTIMVADSATCPKPT